MGYNAKFKDPDAKLPRGRGITNNFYLLGMVAKAVPSLIPFTLTVRIATALSNVLVSTYLFKYVLDALGRGEEIRAVIAGVAVMYGVGVGTEILSQVYYKWYRPMANIRVGDALQKKLQHKASQVELSCYEKPEFFDKFIKASDEAASRAFSVLSSIEQLVWALTTVIANVALVLTISPVFLPLACVPALFTVLFGKRVNRLTYKKDMELKEETRRRSYIRRVFYLADYAKEMRLTDMKKVMMARMAGSTEKLEKLSTRYGRRLALLYPFVWAVPYWGISYLGAVLLAAHKTLNTKTMSLGDCFVVINAIGNISGHLEWLFENLIAFDKHALYIENLREFLEYPVAMPEDEEAPTPADFDTLSLNHVSFTYEGADKPTLTDITMNIRKGERIAIVGHNGAGKTTLVKLLMRLYDVSEGAICLDGTDIRSLRLSAYRDLFGTVFQDSKMFSVTVAENVMLRGDLTEEDRARVKQALLDSDAYERIEQLPRGMDTIVTKEFDDEGVVFSGGEAQKLSVARIFAGHSQIAILDEPSSALDPIAESKMYENMFRACEDKTVIFISHRLSSATLADRVYLFEDGRIAESGTHRELLALGGRYADMWHKQAQKYTEGEVEA